MNVKKFSIVSLGFAGLCWMGCLIGTSGTAESATVTVSNDVIRPAAEVEPLGMNNLGDVGSVFWSAGNIIPDPWAAPTTSRLLYHVIEAGTENGHRYVTLDGPGTSGFLCYASGYLSGADMRAYRIVDKDGAALPYKDLAWAQGGKLQDDTNADHVVLLGVTKVLPEGTPDFPKGGWLAETPNSYSEWSALTKAKDAASLAKVKAIEDQWRVYYEGDLDLQMDDVVIFEKTWVYPDPSIFHPRFSAFIMDWTGNHCTLKKTPLQSPLPKELEGEEAAYVAESTDGNPSSVMMGPKLFGTFDTFFYGTLEAGVTYRYEAWMRQEGIPNGAAVRLGFGTDTDDTYLGNDIGQSFPVTGEWKRYGFEFTAPAAQTGKRIGGPKISFTGPGKLFIENARLMPVYQPGDADKSFVINQTLFKTLLDSQPETGRKGALRLWMGLTSSRMASLLSGRCDAAPQIGGYIRLSPHPGGISLPDGLHVAEATGDSAETRVVPWLIMQVTFTEDEYRDLIEYLAAPYDPANGDTPEKKPWAYQRYLQRGDGRPWTDDFREVIIEFGNENWHNRVMPDWIGFGRFGGVHQFGKEYGLFCRHYMEEIKKSPYWNDAVGKKISFCLGANYQTKVDADGKVTGYGEEATQACGLNQYIGHANYVGPRWEMNEAAESAISDEGFQRTLFGYLDGRVGDDNQLQSKSWQKLQEMGFPVKLAAYESGPSGYSFDRANLAKQKATETYGKSLAMAVATFDTWLNSYRYGWTYQNFLGFGQGNWWSSHTGFANGHRAHPSWMALTMRNRLMRGDLITAQVIDGPTISADLPRGQAEISANKPTQTKQIPLLMAYAMRDNDYYSVALTSHSLTDSIPVTLQLPFNTTQGIRLGYLKGDPRDTNLEEQKVTYQEVPIDPKQLVGGNLTVDDKTGAGAGGMPPGTILIYTFQGVH